MPFEFVGRILTVVQSPRRQGRPNGYEITMSALPPTDNGPVTPSPRHPVTRSRRWVWFFLFLAVVPASLLGVEIWFNLHQQLTPEKLAAARARWDKNGPRDYVLDYEVKREYN